jgi:hypothetical protein
MASPSAEGGYGLAELLEGDKTTVYPVLDRIRAETSETPRLVELPSKGAPIGVRALVGAIVGRELKHGEFTEAVVGRFLFIDYAERLHEDALLWICANLNSVTDVFILVTRDVEAFTEMAGRVSGGADWSLGRSTPVDLRAFLE